MQGRLAQVNAVRKTDELIPAYRLLHQAVTFFQTIRIIDFDGQAATVFDKLRQHKVRIGTLDLRIASVALAVEATLVTRNRRDFEKVPGLSIEDWSAG